MARTFWNVVGRSEYVFIGDDTDDGREVAREAAAALFQVEKPDIEQVEPKGDERLYVLSPEGFAVPLGTYGEWIARHAQEGT